MVTSRATYGFTQKIKNKNWITCGRHTDHLHPKSSPPLYKSTPFSLSGIIFDISSFLLYHGFPKLPQISCHFLLLYFLVFHINLKSCLCFEKLQFSGYLQLWRFKFWYWWLKCFIKSDHPTKWWNLLSHASWKSLRWKAYHRFHRYAYSFLMCI